MRKIILVVLALSFYINIFAEKVKIYVPKAPPAIPFLKTNEQDKNIEIILYTDINSEVLPRILKKEEALYVVPSNVAAKLYNKKVDITMLGITSMGLLHILSSDEKIENLKKLEGQEVYIGDKGSSPDIISRFIFEKREIKPEIIYSSSFEIARFMIAGKAKNCVLPEPLASIIIHQFETKGKYIKRLANMKDEWNDINKINGIPQTAIIVSGSYYKKNQKEIEKIMVVYKKSVEWVNKNGVEASIIGKEIMDSDVPETVIQKSIPNMNLVFIDGKEGMEDLIIYFNILNKYDQATIGGKIPDEQFYGQ